MRRAWFLVLAAVLAASRFAHLHILWTEEDLPLAAALQMLRGRMLYRDVWFDKPPLVPTVYLLWGAETGWPLRAAGALFAIAACWLLYRFARELWGEDEGRLAACLLGFFLIFGIPSALLPLAADSLTLVPHIAAVYLAWRGRPLWSGATAGLAFLFNAKAVFVLLACLGWQYRSAGWLLAGFAIPNAAALGWLAATGALRDWYEQVWWLGALYARSTFVSNPLREGALRTVNWIGFHAALVAGAAWFFARERKTGRLPFALWGVAALASVAGGWRFFPRYYLALLPLAALAAARGLALLGKRRAVVVLLLLLVPLARFGSRYALLARDLAQGRQTQWNDIAMDQASRAAAGFITARAHPGDTLFVWGYRPDLYAYTRMPAATRFLESQPLSGVFADRHLFASAAVAPEWAARHRAELARSRPDFVVDGLAAFNPALAITAYPDLRPWLAQYREAGRAGSAVIYTLAKATREPDGTSIGQREKKGRR
ncbi:MAG TPA: hypothetical protein VHA11_02900 [Bryobacteraceae bacterium]|nr:hypothetical protein [Bryobacteraceae bacterium]